MDLWFYFRLAIQRLEIAKNDLMIRIAKEVQIVIMGAALLDDS